MATAGTRLSCAAGRNFSFAMRPRGPSAGGRGRLALLAEAGKAGWGRDLLRGARMQRNMHDLEAAAVAVEEDIHHAERAAILPQFRRRITAAQDRASEALLDH